MSDFENCSRELLIRAIKFYEQENERLTSIIKKLIDWVNEKEESENNE